MSEKTVKSVFVNVPCPIDERDSFLLFDGDTDEIENENKKETFINFKSFIQKTNIFARRNKIMQRFMSLP